MITVCLAQLRSSAFMEEYSSKVVRKKYFWETFDVMFMKQLASTRFLDKVKKFRIEHTGEVSAQCSCVCVCVCV